MGGMIQRVRESARSDDLRYFFHGLYMRDDYPSRASVKTPCLSMYVRLSIPRDGTQPPTHHVIKGRLAWDAHDGNHLPLAFVDDNLDHLDEQLGGPRDVLRILHIPCQHISCACKYIGHARSRSSLRR
jgi:hypothetical protein